MSQQEQFTVKNEDGSLSELSIQLLTPCKLHGRQLQNPISSLPEACNCWQKEEVLKWTTMLVYTTIVCMKSQVKKHLHRNLGGNITESCCTRCSRDRHPLQRHSGVLGYPLTHYDGAFSCRFQFHRWFLEEIQINTGPGLFWDEFEAESRISSLFTLPTLPLIPHCTCCTPLKLRGKLWKINISASSMHLSKDKLQHGLVQQHHHHVFLSLFLCHFLPCVLIAADLYSPSSLSLTHSPSLSFFRSALRWGSEAFENKYPRAALTSLLKGKNNNVKSSTAWGMRWTNKWERECNREMMKRKEDGIDWESKRRRQENRKHCWPSKPSVLWSKRTYTCSLKEWSITVCVHTSKKLPAVCGCVHPVFVSHQWVLHPCFQL